MIKDLSGQHKHNFGERKNGNNQRNNMEIQGLVYKVKCSECKSIYIGETARKFKIRLNKH